MTYARWRPEFADALDHRFYDIGHLDRLVLGTGEAQMWTGVAAAIVTELRQYPRCTAIHGLVAAGDLEEIVGSLIPAAEAWGRQQGCAYAIIESRPGWQRMLRGHGYEAHQVALCKPL